VEAFSPVSLEDFPQSVAAESPRASLVLPPDAVPGLRAGIWMGGAHSHLGHELTELQVGESWVLDCAGDMPVHFAGIARRWSSVVFADIDERPAKFERLVETVRAWSVELRSVGGADPPAQVYVMCQYGMNRSGLATGLLLRELGIDGDETVSRIVRARPGALSNDSFRSLLREWRP
jgi:protein-tyrosine phosphatase